MVQLDGSGSVSPSGHDRLLDVERRHQHHRDRRVCVAAITIGTHIITLKIQTASGAVMTDTVQIGVTGVDNTSPSVPTGLAPSAVDQTQVDLTWNASTDNVGVWQYSVYRNGAPVGTPQHVVLRYRPAPGTTYIYRVSRD